MSDDLLKEIRDLLADQQRDSRLWAIKDVAWFLCLSEDAARDRMALPSAPKAIRFSNGKSGSHNRWEPSEVRAWALQNREAA